MTATYPTTRRVFAIEEARSAYPLLGGTVRDLMGWENYTYNADLPITPCDGKVFGGGDVSGFTSAWSWQPWTTDDCSPTPQRFINSSYTGGLSVMLCSVYVPPPRVPTAGIRVWVRVELGATNSVGSVEVRSAATGVVYSVAVTYAACGSVLTGAWLSIDGEVQPGDTLEVWLRRSSGGSITVVSVCGYHKAATLWTVSEFKAISQAHVADDRPGHSAILRWLASSANRFQQERAPLQFLASYLGPWAAGNEAGWDATRTAVGHYKVLKGEGVTSIRVEVYAKADAATRTLLVKFDGSTVHTFSVTATSYGWQGASITVTGGTASSVIDVELVYGGEADGYVMVPSVSIWEETAALTLPGAETVPGAFAPNDNGSIVGGEAITSAQWAAMVANMVWLWKYRGLRALVCDSRFSSAVQPVDHHAPGADHESQGVRRFRFADAAGVPRFLAHRHGWNAPFQSALVDESWAWVDEAGSKASAAALTRSQWIQGSTVAGEVSLLSGGTVSGVPGYRVTALASPPWVTAAAQTQDYEVWAQRSANASPDVATTRICGMIIEEMPKNQTAGTRA